MDLNTSFCSSFEDVIYLSMILESKCEGIVVTMHFDIDFFMLKRIIGCRCAEVIWHLNMHIMDN